MQDLGDEPSLTVARGKKDPFRMHKKAFIQVWDPENRDPRSAPGRNQSEVV